MPSRVRETVTGGFNTKNVRTAQTRVSCAGSWNTISSTTTWSGVETRKRIEDCTVPGFFSMLRKGRLLPFNSAVISKRTETRIPAVGDHLHNFVGGCWRAQDVGPAWAQRPRVIDLPPWDEDLIEIVSQQAVSKCKESIFDVLTTMAELGKTAEMVATAWQRVYDFAYRAARQARQVRKRPGYAISLFNDLWLEYRYGWLPAIYSAEDAIKAYNAFQNGRRLIVEKQSQSQALSLTDSKEEISNISNGGKQTIRSIETLTGTRRYTATAMGYADLSNRKYYGFDPLLTAWELVPYSFVVDWFLDVGGWINSISPFSGVSLSGNCASVTDKYEWEQSWDISWSVSHSGSAGPFVTRIEEQIYTRIGISGERAPSWNPRVTLPRVIDAFALITNGNAKINSILRRK